MILMSFRLQSNDKLEIYDLRIEQWIVQGVSLDNNATPLTVAAAIIIIIRMDEWFDRVM